MYNPQFINAHTTLLRKYLIKSSILKLISSIHLCQKIQIWDNSNSTHVTYCSSQSSTSSSKLSHTQTMMIHKVVVKHFAYRVHTQVLPVTAKCQVQFFIRNLTRGTLNPQVMKSPKTLLVENVCMCSLSNSSKTKLMVTAGRHTASHMVSSRRVASCQGTNLHYKEDWWFKLS